MTQPPTENGTVTGPLDLISEAGWTRLAACVGEGPVGWQARLVAHPAARSANGLMQVVPPRGGEGYLLKVLRGETVDRAAEQIAGHWAAQRRLGDHPAFRVPELCGVSPRDDALLMQFVPGRTLQDVLSSDAPEAHDTPEARMTALRRCTDWLSANLQAGETREMPFPIGMMRQRLDRLLQRAAQDRHKIWQAEAFDQLAVLAQEALPRITDQPLVMGARHGDANPGNFLFHPNGTVYGLDLLRPVPQHLCQDVGYLLARSLAYLPGAERGAGLGAALGLDDEMALAATFCLRLEVLGLWRRLHRARVTPEQPLVSFIAELIQTNRLHDLRL